MLRLLWTAFFDNDLPTFRHVLEAPGSGSARNISSHTPIASASSNNNNRADGFASASGSSLPTVSPQLQAKGRKSGTTFDTSNLLPLTKTDINRKDPDGLTLLHHVVSTTDRDILAFASALLACPLVDLYVQDVENGWTALHRAFYAGNIAVALAILERDADLSTDRLLAANQAPLGLIKIKDRDGLGPLDLYADTIRESTEKTGNKQGHGAESPSTISDAHIEADADADLVVADDMDADTYKSSTISNVISPLNLESDTCYTFGSNRNATLGFGDEDDRQRPERIQIKRPHHLIQRFFREHLLSVVGGHSQARDSDLLLSDVPIDSIPWSIRSKPIVIQDVRMAKFHTAVLTTDPEANLYMCGHGQGARLGLGHLQTQFQLACVEGGALAGVRVATIALGQDHTLALTSVGGVVSWGTNTYGQLGYSTPKTTGINEVPMQLLPRQIYGVLKREAIAGVAASKVHSVAFNAASLFTWGKNEGQLGIMDSDARSLEMQSTPRKVAPSLLTSPIRSVCATERATICCLATSDCWVFANFGYTMLQCPANSISNYYLSPVGSTATEMIRRFDLVATGGDTICAITKTGAVHSWAVSRSQDNAANSTSTTGPARIRGALTPGQCIWSPRLRSMDAIDVAVDMDGSVMITTVGGSVWKRARRIKAQKDAVVTSNAKPKDYKTTRVSGLTRVTAVRASSYGSYAAIRKDHDLIRTSISIDSHPLWYDLLPLLWLAKLSHLPPRAAANETTPVSELGRLVEYLKSSPGDVENDIIALKQKSDWTLQYDAVLGIRHSDVIIPVHRAILTGRSPVLRNAFHKLHNGQEPVLSGPLSARIDTSGRFVVDLEDANPLTLVNLALYLYTDVIVEYWNRTSESIALAPRFRQVRVELQRTAAALNMTALETSARQMVSPASTMREDFSAACNDSLFQEAGDARVQLADDIISVHRSFMCARCPFFEALFDSADGYWVDEREGADKVVAVDLGHVDAATFKFVFRYLYTDAGCELFDDVVVDNEDEFVDTVLNVMDVADELMLDKLSQVCQSVLGKRVNLRNVCYLTNAVASSRVSRFKDASLSYMCLNLEALIHARTLSELDDSLMLDLQQAVRQAQAASLPHVRNPSWQSHLLEGDVELAASVKQNRKAKIATMARHSRRLAVDRRGSATCNFDDMDDRGSTSPTLARSKLVNSKGRRTPSMTPDVTGSSSKLLGTNLERFSFSSPVEAAEITGPVASLRQEIRQAAGTRSNVENSKSLAGSSAASGNAATPTQDKSNARPWEPTGGTASPNQKLGLKEIMAQTLGRTSNISLGIAAGRQSPTAVSSQAAVQRPTKLSQKERKRMMQQTDQMASPGPIKIPVTADTSSPAGSPWQKTLTRNVPSLDKIMTHQGSPSHSTSTMEVIRESSPRQLTMRQTIAHQKPETPSRPISSLGAGLGSNPNSGPSTRQTAFKSPSVASSPAGARNVSQPRSIQHSPRAAEPALQLSMADILAQQQLEKDIIRDAGAKRSLQEIQEEQAFQEWWDREVRKQQGLEAPDAAAQAGVGSVAEAETRRKTHGRTGRRGGKAVGRGKDGARERPDGPTGPDQSQKRTGPGSTKRVGAR